MSIKLWLPLINNLSNNGYYATNPSSSGASINTNGKIGGCYKLTNLIDTGLPYTEWDYGSNSMSFGGWFKFNKAEIETIVNAGSYDTSATTPTGCLMGNYSYGGFGLTWNGNNVYSNGSFSSMYIFSHIRVDNNIYSTTSYTVIFDKWIHIFTTFNKTNNKLTFYIDGNPIGSTTTSTFTLDNIRTKGNMCINVNSVYGGNGPSFRIPMYVNDIRLYDHCLSPREVKEISKGLVLHYPLNQPERNPNIINTANAVSSGNRIAINNANLGGKVTTTALDGDTYCYLMLNETLVAGTTYTLSFNASNIDPDSNISYAPNNKSAWGLAYLKNGRCSVTFTPTEDIATKLLFDDINRTISASQGNYTMEMFKLEKDSIATPYCPSSNDSAKWLDGIEYDTSGFNYNGTITSEPLLKDSQGRYNHCYYLDGTDDTITIPFNNCVKSNEWTMSVWFYKDSFSSKSWDTIFGGPSGFELETKNGSTDTPVIYAYSWGKGSFSYELNKWNHLAMVRTASDTKFYLNGELKLTGSAGSMPTGNYFIGAWNTSTQQNYKGRISEFRIYTTALSANDIKELYNTPVSITNNGNIMTQGEFIEE